MRILLIKCRFLKEGLHVITPPLGITYLASYIRTKERDAKIKLIDMEAFSKNEEGVFEEIKKFSPDVVGLSALTIEAEQMHKIASLVKKLSKNIPVIAGGPHPSMFPYDVLTDENIDYVVKGEGEITFYELLRSLSAGKSPEGVKGIYFREDGNIVFTGEREPIYDLDSLPFPAWDLLDIKRYKRVKKFTLVRSNLLYLPIFTSRACPYECIYCHSLFGRGFRKRSPLNVVSEMEEFINRFGVQKFEVVDDIFNLDEERAKNICEMIIKRGWKIFPFISKRIEGG